MAGAEAPAACAPGARANVLGFVSRAAGAVVQLCLRERAGFGPPCRSRDTAWLERGRTGSLVRSRGRRRS
jgi:hypothetical protein